MSETVPETGSDKDRPDKDRPDKDRLIRGRALVSTISNTLGQIVTFGTGFLMTPFILHQLGRTDYGLWLLVGSLVAYGGLFDFGITAAVTKFIAEFQARNEMERARSLVATALWLYILLGLLVVALAFMLAPVFPVVFNVTPGEQDTAVTLVRLMGLGLGFSIPSGTTYAVLRGLQRFDYINFITAGGTLLTAVVTIAVLMMGGGLVAMVAVNIPLNLVMQIPALILIQRAYPGFKIGLRGASRSLVRPVFSYSSSSLAIQTAQQLRNKTDEIVIGAFLPVSFVTPYGIARRLSEAALLLTHQFLRIIIPLASQLDAEQDTIRLRALYLASTRLSMVIFLPIGLSLSILAGPLLSLWVGSEYAEYAYLVWILTAAGLFFVVQGPASMILQGIARHRWPAVVAVLSGLVNLGMSIVLVQRYGLAGVAVGTLVPNALETAFFILPYANKLLEIRTGQLVRKVFLPALLPAVPMALVMTGLVAWLQPLSVLSIGIAGGAGALVYAALYLALGASGPEREYFFEVLSSVKGRLAALRASPPGEHSEP